MATESQILDFISRIAPCAQKAYKELGKVYPSICIGMACVESAYGTAGSCFHNSYLGQKVGTGKTAARYWGGKFFTSKTKEEYTVGVHTTINAAFRSYDSMEQCVFNYYELLNSKLYSGVSSGVPFTTQMQQIKNCGYMTSSTEVKYHPYAGGCFQVGIFTWVSNPVPPLRGWRGLSSADPLCSCRGTAPLRGRLLLL